MDTMANFIGRLGAFAPPVLELADCGCMLGGTETIDATIAMQRVLQRYAELSTQGEKLRQILLKGATVPCEVWAAYNQACIDYVQKSQQVFDQLAQRGIVVDQVVYSQGQPVMDPNNPGQFRTIRVSAPLRPMVFTFVQQQCPGVPNFQGPAVGGWQPVPIELGSVTETVLVAAGVGALFILTGGTGAIIGAAGYAAYKIYSQVAVWISDYLESPKRIVDAYTNCFEAQTKAGASDATAASRCSDVQKAALEYGANKGGWSFWTWVLVGGGLLIAGGALTLYLRKKALGFVPRAQASLSGPRRRPVSRQYRPPVLLGKLYLEP